MALFYRALLSGKMASSSDVITSLGTPVDLVPMEETVSEAAKTKLIGKFRLVQARRGVVEATHIVSQHAGIVQEILVREGQFLAKGEVAVTVERPEARLTMGWVSERFAETVFIGMSATIGFNEGGEKVSINGTVVDVTAGDHPERPGEFGIIVTIQPLGLAPGEACARLRNGAPVNLEAERQIYSRAKAWVKSWLPTDV